MGKKLTGMQQAFVEQYIVTENALQSAMAAGYSEKTARAKSYGLLQNQAVKEQIAKRRRELVSEKISPEQVLLALHKIGIDDSTDFSAFGVPTRGEGKYKGSTKLRALELMGRAIGLFREKEEGESEEVVQIIDDV